MVGLRERWVMKVAEVGLDREVGNDDWEGWCRVGDSMCVCLCGWVGGCVFE